MNSQPNSTRVKAPATSADPSKSTVVPTTNEGLVPKPTGRSKPDNDEIGKAPFLRRKTPVIISTYNTQSLASKIKIEELVYETKQIGIDIICIQEHRRVHSEELLTENING